VLNSLGLESVGRSEHRKDEVSSVSLVKLDVVNLRDVDGVLIGGDVLLDMDEVDLRDVDGSFKGRNDLLDSNEVDLRDVNG